MLELNIFVFHCFVGNIYFICSQKKNTQLVYRGYIYNKKATQLNGNSTWRCMDLAKTRCKAIVRTQNGHFLHVREKHHHGPHAERLHNRMLYRNESECLAQENPRRLKGKRRTNNSLTSDIKTFNDSMYGEFSDTEYEMMVTS